MRIIGEIKSLWRWFVVVSALLAVGSAAVPLKIGDSFPVVAGETLSGNRMTLPAGVAGNSAIVVFSFSRVGGTDARLWNDRVASDAGLRGITSFTLMMLESVPRILRGMVSSSIRKQVPPAMYDRFTLIFRDEEMWKQRLAAFDDRHAYVLLINDAARICWMGSGRFSDLAFQQLKEAVLRARQ
ncbi:MAG: mitochondrial ATPase complex subunit ATP10 [Acidobacteriota bacterium]|nr:mitochondrial ATPase complex subunit ATP10 [Acidobacteriota bacterium]